jgi:signal transduction histidine kinase
LKSKKSSLASVKSELQKSKQHYSQLLKESRNMQGQLRHLSHRLLIVQEEERKKISRELHDEISQTLTGISVKLAALKNEVADSAKGLKEKIASTQRLVEKSVEKVHRFARELRPSVLDDLGLIPALRSYIKEFTKRTGINIMFTTFAGIEKLDNFKRTVLYRVAQEALINVDRHAQASDVKLSIRYIRNVISMEIKDNGKSFQVEHVLLGRRNQRLGLLGMRERMEMINGSFDIKSLPGEGTTVRAFLPQLRSL